jgi:hypothetical protein
MAKRPLKPSPEYLPNIPETLQSVLNELNTVLERYKADLSHETETDIFIKGIHAGFEHGINRAIDIVNYEIGIRQDPPNIFYGMKKMPPEYPY